MKVDTLIVGSGVAGGLAAEHLSRKGSVLILEAGPDVVMRDRRTWLDFVMAGRLPYDSLGDRDEDYQSEGVQAWRIEGGRLFARGGSTLHWGGWCPRMKPEDFQLASRIGSGGLDWPFDYETLEPYYTRAEAALQVAGDSNEQDPPRKGSYPFEAPTYTQVDGLFIKAMDRLGVRYGRIPVARNGAAVHDHPPCMTTGTCEYCPVGGRYTADQTLDRLAKRPTVDLILNAAVTRLIPDTKKRVAGVMYRDLISGVERRVEASRVILCAGALETPKLMLASSSPEWPQGVGNDTDHVGRHLVANPYFFANAGRETNPRKLQEELFFPTLGSRHWDGPEQQREGKFLINRGESPNLNLADRMIDGAKRADLEAAASGAHVVQLLGAAQTFSHRENRVRPGAGTTRFGVPKTLIETPVEALSKEQTDKNLGRMRGILEAMGYTMLTGPYSTGVYPQRGDHAMCTTRMSIDPGDGVVDPNHRVHGMDNLYVLSNAVFPSGAAANPTLTLAAMALKFFEQF